MGETRRSSKAFSLVVQATSCKHHDKKKTNTIPRLAAFRDGHAAHGCPKSFLLEALKNEDMLRCALHAESVLGSVGSAWPVTSD